MLKTTCKQRLHDGLKSRQNSPLLQGCYKIREVIDDFSDIPAEVDRIRGVRMRKVSADTLRHCTAQDSNVWIRSMPLHVAHSLGRNLLPGLLAAVNEGASPDIVCQAHTDLLQRCEALTGDLDSVLNEAGGDVLTACHLLEPLFQEAIYLAQQALAVADFNGHWK